VETLMAHVRVPWHRVYRRNGCWMTRVEEWEADAATLCGAPVTDRDWNLRDVTTKKAIKEGWIKDICPNCLAVVDNEYRR